MTKTVNNSSHRLTVLGVGGGGLAQAVLFYRFSEYRPMLCMFVAPESRSQLDFFLPLSADKLITTPTGNSAVNVHAQKNSIVRSPP